MTDDVVARAREALRGVTEGPWVHMHPDQCCADHCIDIPGASHCGMHDLDMRYEDAQFIAAARELVPELIAEVERLSDLMRRDTATIASLQHEITRFRAES